MASRRIESLETWKMESDYDRKFEEMKSYIPFLESMLTRLSVGNSLTNPRQAQLDKIKSLRDLLLNKKKRMKIENLLKCEQVLITLHAKVALQQDAATETKSKEKNSDSSNLNFVRNKLKSVVSKLNQDTLPNIARASDKPQVDYQGNKEPALFLRRPNQKSLSPRKSPLSDKKTSPQSSKRNYTRVLHSPENSSRHWPEIERPLFSRRSPRNISKKFSLSYRKGKKKSKKSKRTELNDLNITLNVPEDKLNSLDTEDILSRIINCSDSDVDIATLRELRSQILGELKHTGVKDDISDLLLKSCKTNKIKNKAEKSNEVEEGELSDSESETIENIYGNLIITNKDSLTVETSEKNKSRKIQICLVINSDKNEQKSKSEATKSKSSTTIDSSEFESFSQTKTSSEVVTDFIKIDENQLPQDNLPRDDINKVNDLHPVNKDELEVDEHQEISKSSKSIEKDVKLEEKTTFNENVVMEDEQVDSKINSDVLSQKNDNESVLLQDNQLELNKSKCFVPNFYKPTKDVIIEPDSVVESKNPARDVTDMSSTVTIISSKEEEPLQLPNKKGSVEIPLLNLEETAKQDIVSEIDILQALKKEILGESTTPSPETITPALHQPKITKVASAQEIVKKRISIENYKQKCQDPPQPLYFRDISEKMLTDDQYKKQSIKLTEKECERFNLPTKLPLNDSSDDDNDVNISLVDVYSEMAPKSPDHEDFADTGIKPPVIIPCDPVKPSVIHSFVDIDMRKANTVSQIPNNSSIVSETKILNVKSEAEKQIKLSDPRKSKSRWEKIQPDIDILLPVNAAESTDNQRPNMTPSRNLCTPNMTPSRQIALNTPCPLITSNITPNFVSNKTPSIKTYEMTPSRLNSEDTPGRKHVYAPMTSGANTYETNESRYKDVSEISVWETNTISRDMEYDSRDPYGSFDRPQTSIHSYGRHETPTTSLPSFGKPECPSTPLPSFGRMECPTTPLPSFGRTERGITPVNSYTRVDGSSTPIHPYNRLETLSTPGHSFDRLDGSSTPIHSYGQRDKTPSNAFGRHDRPRTPVHSFGEQDGSGTPAYSYNYLEGSTTPCQTFGRHESYGRNDYVKNYHSTKPMYGRTDHRFTKSSDYDNYNRQSDREYVHYRERTFHSDNSSGQRGSEYYRRYEHNFGRTEMNRYRERYSERYNKDNMSGKNQFNKYSLNKDRETCSRRNNRDYKLYNERNFTQREKSEERNHYTNRATANSYEKDNNSGNRGFIIDKSVSTTFQKFEEKDRTLHSFDSRRQRAASVGRVLTREHSFSRTTQDLKLDELDSNNKRKDFHRASSVGRELQSQRSESFKNIKDDLRSFKFKNDLNLQKKFGEKKSDKKMQSQNENNKSADIRKIDDKHPIKRKSFNERYSLRNNYRDPRLRESRFKYEKSQFHYQRKGGIIYSDANISKGTILGPSCSVKNYKIPKIKRSPEKTTENHTDSVDIHIKKPADKIDLTRKTMRNSEDQSDNNYNIKDQECKATTSNKKCDKKENVQERIDDSSVKTDDSNEDFIIRRSKKTKTKSVVYDDSDSDSEKKIETVQQDFIKPRGNIDSKKIENSANIVSHLQKASEPTLQKTGELDVTVLNFESIQNDSSISIDDTKVKGKTLSSESVEDNANKEAISTQAKPTDFSEQLQSKDINQQSFNLNKNNLSKEIGPVGTKNGSEGLNSFGDLEIFSDNIVTDPILDNINDLIADLDHDLDTSKNDEVRAPFRQDFLLDHMFDSIKQDNNIIEDKKKSGGNEKTSIVVMTGENNISSLTKDQDQEELDVSNNSDSVTKASADSLNFETKTIKAKKIDVDNSNDAIVSTTKDDMKSLSEGNRLEHCHVTFDSKPDSTISSVNQSKSVEEIVPDSTNEPNEGNELISSSNTETPNYILNVDSSQSTNKNDSIGNFLSILQNKSKIKELLGLLGEHAPENEKIKRKLLQLSAIVSDDEDDNIDNLSVTNNDNLSVGAMNEKRQNNIDKEEKLKQHQNDLPEMSIAKKAETENLEENVQSQAKDNLDNIVKKLDNTAEILKQGDNLEVDVTDATENDTENLKNMGKSKILHSDVQPEFEIQQKNKTTRKGRSKKMSKGSCLAKNRKTNSGDVAKSKVKKPSRELLNLQADIRNNFLKEDVEILGGTTGLRMCRLAKLVDGKTQKQTKAESPKDDTTGTVRVEKLKKNEDTIRGVETISKRKKSNKSIKTDKKNKVDEASNSTVSQKDPYLFETDSVCESLSTSEKRGDSTEDDSDSAESFKSESSEKHIPGVVKKRPKRKRSAWQSGIIVPKNRKKKSITPKLKAVVSDEPNNAIDEGSKLKIIDLNFYIDKSYCFSKNILVYDCRLCDQKASDIVYHYRKEHPHTEIPLSRMSPDIALEAIKQCETTDFLAISQIPSHRYVCRFCFKEFVNCKTLENFFWHIVSTHTGEYKQSCPVCIEDEKCPLALDIPPLKQKGQLIGFICGNCNYTQLSLENLKTHVITRHNDEQTEVYKINMSHMTAKSLNMLLRKTKTLKASEELEEQRVLRSARSNVSTDNALDRSNISEESDHESISSVSQESSLPISKNNTTIYKTIQSKISYETDSDSEKMTRPSKDVSYKIKDEPKDIDEIKEFEIESVGTGRNGALEKSYAIEETGNERVNDIDESPHFKVTYSESGSKQYVCCITDYAHYKTSLLISFKKHVQTAHIEKWDGYCCVCKVIVMPQGIHSYKNCLDHFIDKHLDNFPVIENTTEKLADKPTEKTVEINVESVSLPVRSSPKTFLSVRPLAELLPNNESYETSVPLSLPVIESVISLTSEAGVTYPTRKEIQDEPKSYLYEEAQAEVLSAKNRIILDAMMAHEKLVQVFKCAGRFCSYTTDSAEDALLHVSTHIRVGGVNALKCAYCNFDCLDNAIDLVTHVFKSHGFCQYVCGYCFYRAAASQLVNAHITRVHENVAVKTVLKTAFMTEPVEGNILSREAAVPVYVCSCDDDEAGSKCNFKTYTPGKLCEHVKSKHKDVTIHECFICKATTDSVGELVQHYKEHDLKLYQCAWCVFGADNETELLTHSSIHHAVCQPKAYLRVITNKEGTTEFRVLPLAHLNKSNTPNTTEVDVTNGPRENPVREAERSVDLEKLIGHATSFIVSVAATDKETPNEIPPDELSVAESMLNLVPAPVSRPNTPFTTVAMNQPTTPIIETEKATTNTPDQSTSDVICLDSDEDDISGLSVPKQSAPITPIQEPASSVTRKTRTRLKYLYKCANCSVMSKTASAFKAHLGECFANIQNIGYKCAHCPFMGSKKNLISHYKQAHFQNNNIDFLNSSESSPSGRLEKGMQHIENNADIVLSAKKVGGVTVRELAAKKNSKRKSSAGSSDEPPVKMKKYGPQDISQLPINPIFDNFVYCSLCEFNTKVRLNMVRHLQLHASQRPVPQTAPVNPVPHLETNEMHFDKMVNLASSSLVTRLDKNNRNETSTIPLPPERVSWYPKYVPERTRHTCGAKDCSYISVDESMLKYHWETLHSGSTDFHCVHCPPYQTLDKRTPLSASRIIAHLKMHDAKLYACSQCKFYHFKQTVVEKHVNEVHKVGNVLVVREEITSAPQMNITAVHPATAPTMDLKPWQCGLCEYQSLLRPEVVEHCAKFHTSKMQFKCVYCAFRTSNEENITKHQLKSHQELPVQTFYFYYREGSMSGESDGTPFWKMQKNKYSSDAKIKSETGAEAATTSTTPVTTTPPAAVNLSLVKREVVEESIENLCQKFGQFCEPNGLRYKCPLCKTVIEDTKEAMQSHLFEELQYRRWKCSICLYKAFHKHGLNVHMETEHRVNRDPFELPVDSQVETWVTSLLEHQETIINNFRNKLAEQKTEIQRENKDNNKQQTNKLKSLLIQQTPTMSKTTNIPSNLELESKFGSLGVPKGSSFCCPKCNEVIKEESAMRDHLESELNKIRWCCSTCPETFTSYHQAQFHCKVHSGQSSRPVEAPRDSVLRSAWVDAAVEVQKLSMNSQPSDMEQRQVESAETQENSLLVVRYEERVPTPESQSFRRRMSPDSDDDRLISIKKRKAERTSCPYCEFSSPKKKILNEHILKHYNLKSYTCEYCKATGTLRSLRKHQKIYHAMKPVYINPTPLPTVTPTEWFLKKLSDVPLTEIICLTCQSRLPQSAVPEHLHDNSEPEFGRIGEVIVRCSTCSTLHKDIHKFEEHKIKEHPNDGNYVFYKLSHDNRQGQVKCSFCPQKFTLKKDLKTHIQASHAEEMKYATIEPRSSKDVIILDDEEDTLAEVTLSPRKMVARKSTSKLPFFKTVARKSTTKLPMESQEEYSFYGSKPHLDGLENVTTMMPFYNSFVPITFERLNKVINVNPRIVLTKLPNQK